MATQTGSLDLRAVKQTYIKTVAKAQAIYKRTNSNSAPTAPTSKITASTDQTTTGNWTTMHMSRIYASNTAYKYLWTCNQFLAPDGTFLGCSEVVADEGTTVIDGANIVTGSVTAEKLNVSDINASGKLTVGAMTSAAQATILNENVESYDIEPSYPYVEMDTNGSDPTSITVSAKYTKGSNAPTAYSGRFKIETSEDNTNWTTTYTSSANESSTTITTPTAVEDNVPYTYRTSPSSGLVDEKAIVGGTIAWNQLANKGAGVANASTISYDSSSGITTVTPTNYASDNSGAYNLVAASTAISGHKYLCAVDVNPDNAVDFRFGFTPVKTSAVVSANSWTRIATIISRTSASFVLYARLGSNSWTSGGFKFRHVQCFDLTQMFGSTIADYIYSLETATAGAGVAWFRKLFPNSYYEYNAGELLSVSAVEKRTVGKNLLNYDVWKTTPIQRGTAVWENNGVTLTATGTDCYTNYTSLFPAEAKVPVTEGETITMTWESTESTALGGVYIFPNGTTTGMAVANNNAGTLSYTPTSGVEYVAFRFGVSTSGNTVHYKNIMIRVKGDSTYEPYKRNTYPLSDIELRGIPKLDGSNLYYDGDVYEPSGKVTRKYGIVDLGTLTWYGYGGSYPNLFYTGNLEGVALPQGYLVCSANYDISKNGSSVGDSTHQHHIGFNMNARLYINDTAYTSGTAFKTAMSGVMLVYELATPTTKTTTPYSQTQIAGSTEEFVTNNVVPVGHNSSYSSAIKAIRASLYKAGGTTTLLTQTVIPCRTGSTGLAGTAIETANESAKTATSYITAIDESGIKVHAADNVNSNYAKIDADGMEVYKGGNSVAKYSDTSRVGQQSTRHIEIKDGGLQVYQDASTVMAHIGYGSGNATSGTATAPYYVLGKLNGSPTLGNYSMTEGLNNVASGAYSHAEGAYTTASRAYSHSEGYDTEANGNGSHASGLGTIAQGAGQMAIGHYNIANGTYNQFNSSSQILIVGNGTGDDARSNAMVVDASGNVDISGSYKVNGTAIDAYVKTTFTPTSGSSYSNYGGCYYEKYGRLVHVHVGVSGLTTSTSTNIFTLPTGYRPSSPIYAHGTGGAWNNIGYLEISTAGVVNVRSQGTYCGADAFFIV